MADDFKSMASQAKQKFEAKVVNEEEQRQIEQDERAKTIEAGIDALQSEVLPLLQDAMGAFHDEGVPSDIEPDFDVSNSLTRDPKIRFQFSGPERRNRSGGVSKPESIPVFVSSDGECIEVKVGDYPHAAYGSISIGTAKCGEAKEIIAEGIKRAIDSYYERLKELRQFRHWD